MRNASLRILIGVLVLSLISGAFFSVFPARNAQAVENGILTGTVWFDDNTNGNRDPGEERASGATVKLTGFGDNGQRLEAQTDEDGNYTVRIAPGNYAVEVSAIKPGRSVPPDASITHKGEATTIVESNLTREASIALIPQKGRVSAKIEIVWPHDAEGAAKPASQAPLVNIGVYIFSGPPDSLVSVPCEWEGNVRLWAALNNNPAQIVGTGDKKIITRNNIRYPQWEFNNIDVSAALKSVNRIYFFITIDSPDISFDPTEGVPLSSSNVWAHATDARTFYPEQETPTASSDLSEVDARIQIVWPHDGKGNAQPVSTAKRVNISALLLQHTTSIAPTESWDRNVYLLVTRNNDGLSKTVKGTRRIVNRNGKIYPVWDFNDIDLTGGTDSSTRYFFRTIVAGMPTYSSVWAHGADARTIFPQADIPTAGCQ